MRYLCDPHILPTNTCPGDLAELARRTEAFADFAPEIQLDISDGLFSPVTSWPYNGVQWSELEDMAASGTQLPMAERVGYEVHLMVQEPEQLGILLAQTGVRRIMPHVETLDDVERARETFAAWKAAGAREVGLSLLIDTPLESVAPYADVCDVIQLMSIARIGAQGQPFDERSLTRVEELHAAYPDMVVAVDGGVSEANIELLVRAGANRLCVGSAISKAPKPSEAYARMLERAQKGCAPIPTEAAIA